MSLSVYKIVAIIAALLTSSIADKMKSAQNYSMFEFFMLEWLIIYDTLSSKSRKISSEVPKCKLMLRALIIYIK